MRDYRFAEEIKMCTKRIPEADAIRQADTAREILHRLRRQPGVVLADEVGMGKTFVALAVAVSIILNNRRAGPVIVMIPPNLKGKWPRDWSVFKDKCLPKDRRERINATTDAAENGVEFLNLLEDRSKNRPHLIFLTHGALSRGLSEPWVKLALIKRALSRPKLAKVRHCFPRFAPDFLRMSSRKSVTPDLFQSLLFSPTKRWRGIIEKHGIELQHDPVPTRLIEKLRDVNLDGLAEALREYPIQRTWNLEDRIGKARSACSREIERIWEGWLSGALRSLSLPLLILDEAHHLKNDETRIASLFASEEAHGDAKLLEGRGPLHSVFERMLFLTATPFQLGHGELLRVLSRFENISWRRASAPLLSRDETKREWRELHDSLNKAQHEAAALDRIWGRLTESDLCDGDGRPQSVDQWWKGLLTAGSIENGKVAEVRRRYEQCWETMRDAERYLAPWVIRHIKPRYFPDSKIQRRQVFTGAAIVDRARTSGIEVSGASLLPFLLAGRAQAVAAAHKIDRALFAEGLASSYEACLQTLKGRPEIDEDDALPQSVKHPPELKWYLDYLNKEVSRSGVWNLKRHPKIEATVRFALDSWEKGEKVLIFCHYRETGKALRNYISQTLDRRIYELARRRFGLPDTKAAQARINLLKQRLSDKTHSWRRSADALVNKIVRKACIGLDSEENHRITEIILRFFRTPSFLARYIPKANMSPESVVKYALDQRDSSRQRLRDVIRDFCVFLAERTSDERRAYLDALESISTGSHWAEQGSTLANVRLANGETRTAERQNLMLAFNTPFFPEILISSSVLAEGVDLQLHCRLVVHHDLCWNPSTLEQRTGRVDRLGAKVERCGRSMRVGRYSIEVYLPYIEATQDEKMFRVVRDRERWFQIVMGEDFEISEAVTDRIAERIPFPEEAAESIAMRLNTFGNRG